EPAAVRGPHHLAAVGVERRDGLVEVRRRGRQLDAELADPRDVVEMTADDLGGLDRSEVNGVVGPHAAAVRCHEPVAVAPHDDRRTAEPHTSRLHEAHLRTVSDNAIDPATAPRRSRSGRPRREAPWYVARRPHRREREESSVTERVRVLWPDHLGLPRGKYIPERLADRGIRHCKGTWALGYDRVMTPYTPGSGWEAGLPDMEATFDVSEIRPGWEDGTKVVVADLVSEGAPVAVSPRAALRKAVADWD